VREWNRQLHLQKLTPLLNSQHPLDSDSSEGIGDVVIRAESRKKSINKTLLLIGPSPVLIRDPVCIVLVYTIYIQQSRKKKQKRNIPNPGVPILETGLRLRFVSEASRKQGETCPLNFSLIRGFQDPAVGVV
jgi:hypothetical protein